MKGELGFGSGVSRHFCMAFPRKKGPVSSSTSRTSAVGLGRAVIIFFLIFFLGFLVFSGYINTSIIENSAVKAPSNPTIPATSGRTVSAKPKTKPLPPPLSPFTCPLPDANLTCPRPPPPSPSLFNSDEPTPTCPDYFRWIHEDLKPWKETGITKEMVERARRTANFRLVVLNGRAYVEQYSRSYQTRDVFTLWGILQLLRRYPGRVPDLDLMFDCVDWPVVRAQDYRPHGGANGKEALAPPPLFRYCGDDSTLDIVFPDWSFWGWAEINIKPWEALTREMKEGNMRSRWIDREPYAYWKGNPLVADTRKDLLKCNVSDKQDWNGRLFAQDWGKESSQGFKESNLANQCNYRYKIYIEGSAWSVSEKYILACDSPTLLVTPEYYDFFTRDLMPVHHYWPIRTDDKCRSIKFAVDWGNRHKQKAQAIGKEASDFIQEKLKMDYVYDYMFHLLNEYAKLMRFKPAVAPKAVELCSESMACHEHGLRKKFMMESMVNVSRSTGPCTLPPPFSPMEMKLMQKRKANSIKQVEIWERKAQEGYKN